MLRGIRGGYRPPNWCALTRWHRRLGAPLALLAVLAAPPVSVAQGKARCNTPKAREFDFWIGDWAIQQRMLAEDGTWLRFSASSSVSPTLDGCAIIEHWSGTVQFFWDAMRTPEPMTGLSLRAYDSDSDRWYIHWMDTRTPRFDPPYAGRFREGRGEFYKEWETPQGMRLGRISFSPVSPDSVHWELAVSSDSGRTWSPLWIMEMRRRRK